MSVSHVVSFTWPSIDPLKNTGCHKIIIHKCRWLGGVERKAWGQGPSVPYSTLAVPDATPPYILPATLPRYPEIIPHLDPLCRPHLVLPLSRHHFSIGATQCYARIETRLVMRLHHLQTPPNKVTTHQTRRVLTDLPAIDPVSTYSTIVRALRTREACLGPTKWVAI